MFDLIPFLIAERHRVVTKFELLDAVWGNRFVSECALTSRTRSARKALRDDGERQEVIRTTRGKGHGFVAQATEVTIGSIDDVSQAPEPLSSFGVGLSVGGDQLMDRPRKQHTESRGHSIAFQVFGEGSDTLVLILGFSTNLEIAREQWRSA